MRGIKTMSSVLGCMLIATCAEQAKSKSPEQTSGSTTKLILDASNYESLFQRVGPWVAEQYPFSGLASYFNNLEFFIAEDGSLTALEAGEEIRLRPGQFFVAKGRFKVLTLKAPGLAISIGDQRFDIAAAPANELTSEIRVVAKPQLRGVIPELDGLRYSHLGMPLATLTRAVEWSLVGLHRLGVSNWGMVIVVFAVLMKILLLPLSLLTQRLQNQVSQFKSQLAPQLAEIKAGCDGEEAHNRIMAAHRELGITPFYTLKPLATSLVLVPILIATFNALGEMPQLSGASFLWIDDLAYPDVIATLPVVVPMFGGTVSLLPFLMTAITIFSTLIFKNRHALPAELRAQKRNLYLMAAGFLVLFYPFPAGMVLFWALANVLQTAQQQLVKL